MKLLKVAIVHFQPLEKYPPVMNLLIYLQEVTTFQIKIYTTEDNYYKKKLFRLKAFNIYRFGSFCRSQSFILRYINYLVFNCFTFFRLLFTKPSSIICYETLSVFPVYLYKKLFPATKIFIHYHEYTSLNEIAKSSLYIKWLNYLEKKMFFTASWISHTNEERLFMFKQDYKHLFFSQLEALPNYPPLSWYKINRDKSSKKEFPVKFVYVGALGMNTTYTREFAQWIKELNGKATWDIYSTNYQEEVLNFLKNLNSPFINFLGEVNYYNLPNVLKEYDVGLVLYNGHIPNYVYNVPNKLFEYHACDLDVWVSENIKGSLPYIKEHTYPKILKINFKNLSNVNLPSALNRQGINYHSFNYSAEEAFTKLISSLR